MGTLAHDEDGSFTSMAMAAEGGPVGGYNADHSLYVEFYVSPVQDQQATAQEGRPVFKDVEYVKIMVPGDKNSIIQRPARIGRAPMHDNNRFAAQYRAFKVGEHVKMEGTPLKEWPLITSSQVKELAYFQVHTVEQLAAMPDSVAQKHMGINRLKAQANAYIENAKGNAGVSELQAELTKARQTSEALQQQMAEQAAMIAELQKGMKPTALDVDDTEDDDDLDAEGDEDETAEAGSEEAAEADAEEKPRRGRRGRKARSNGDTE